MDQERLRDGRRDAEAGIQRLVRILVDDLHAAAKLAEIVLRERRDVDPVEAHAARLRRDEPENRLRSRRLAAARLTDERDHLAASHAERDAGDRMHVPVRATKQHTAQPAGDAVADDQVLDLEQRPAVVRGAAHLHDLQRAREVARAACGRRPPFSARAAPTCSVPRPGRSAERTDSRGARRRVEAARRGSTRRRRATRGRESPPRAAAYRDAASRGREHRSAPARRSSRRTSQRRACTSGRRSVDRA